MNCVHCGTPIPSGSKFCLECGTDLSHPGGAPRTVEKPNDLTRRLTQTLEGRYRVDKLLGRGGMGAVFLANDLTLERPVAIKVLPPDVSHDDNLVARFGREARTAAKLDHPNIIPIFAVESTGGLHYFVMKYVAGDSLERFVAEGRLPIPRCQGILWEAARALGHAHERGVVHRDIKPGNIMLDHDGRVMLADFGISKAVQSATQFTGTGQVIGTPFYMSPEQAKGQTVDGRSDQYSLAVVAFELLTGRLPFGEDAVHALLFKQIFEEPPRIATLQPDVPPFLAAAVHRALAKDPDDRFATMDDFASAVMPERPVSTPRVSAAGPPRGISVDATTVTPTTGPTIVAPTKTRPHPARRAGVASIAASAVLLLVGGAGYWAWQQGFIGAARPESTPDARTLASAPSDPDAVPDSAADAVAAVRADSEGAEEGSDLTARETPPPRAAAPERSPVSLPQAESPRPTRTSSTRAGPRFGTVSVDVLQGWGTVFIDGAQIRRTPLIDHRLTAGRHEIRITNPRCAERVDTLVIAAGQHITHRQRLQCGG